MKSLNLKYKHWKITKFKVAILVFYLFFIGSSELVRYNVHMMI